MTLDRNLFFFFYQGLNIFNSSANEYVHQDSAGRFIGLTDETFGFGFVTYCDEAATAPGCTEVTTTASTV